MRELFREFYQNQEIDFKNLEDDTLIVIDANVLLHIFRFSIDARKELFEAFEKVADNLWVPYIAALEFHFNKQSVIRGIKQKKDNFGKIINVSTTSLIEGFNKEMDEFGKLIRSNDESKVRNEIKSNFKTELEKFVSEFKKEKVEKEFELVGDVEDKSDVLAELLLHRVGQAPDQDKIDEIEQNGQKRYDIKFPPGYMDEKEKKDEIRKYGEIQYHRKFGDLLIWKDIINAASDVKIKKVIYVSDDLKEDWIYISKGQKVGPRAELKKELIDEANADLYTMESAKFISEVNDKKLGEKITKEPIDYQNIVDSSIILNEDNVTYRKRYSDELLERRLRYSEELLKRFNEKLFESEDKENERNRYKVNQVKRTCLELRERIRILRNAWDYEADLSVDKVLTLKKIESELNMIENQLEDKIPFDDSIYVSYLVEKMDDIKEEFERLRL